MSRLLPAVSGEIMVLMAGKNRIEDLHNADEDMEYHVIPERDAWRVDVLKERVGCKMILHLKLGWSTDPAGCIFGPLNLVNWPHQLKTVAVLAFKRNIFMKKEIRGMFHIDLSQLLVQYHFAPYPLFKLPKTNFTLCSNKLVLSCILFLFYGNSCNFRVFHLAFTIQ